MKFLKALPAVALISTAACVTPPTEDCFDQIISSQSRAEAKNVQTVDAMIAFLSTKTKTELAATDVPGIDALDDTMRQIFLNNREVRTNSLGEPQPITAGAGFGTVDASGVAVNLLGVYQANTASGICNYPFAPSTAQPIDPDDPASDLVPYVASAFMQGECQAFPAICSTMQSSVFLNVSNPAIYGTNFKSFFDDGRINPGPQVGQTDKAWAPGGGNPANNWANLGWQNFNNGDSSGHHVIYVQSDLNQYILLYYKPFVDSNGDFAGTAYSFVNLFDEYLANTDFQNLIDTGVCPMPTRTCNDGVL